MAEPFHFVHSRWCERANERIAELEAKLEMEEENRLSMAARSCITCQNRSYCTQTVGFSKDPISYREVTYCSRYWAVPGHG